jgi:hypothetical protein
MSVLGMTDPWIWGAYIGCIVITIICVIYGAINWNKD